MSQWGCVPEVAPPDELRRGSDAARDLATASTRAHLISYSGRGSMQ